VVNSGDYPRVRPLITVMSEAGYLPTRARAVRAFDSVRRGPGLVWSVTARCRSGDMPGFLVKSRSWSRSGRTCSQQNRAPTGFMQSGRGWDGDTQSIHFFAPGAHFSRSPSRPKRAPRPLSRPLYADSRCITAAEGGHASPHTGRWEGAASWSRCLSRFGRCRWWGRVR
jgi:hypothetical protein